MNFIVFIAFIKYSWNKFKRYVSCIVLEFVYILHCIKIAIYNNAVKYL